MANQGGNLKSTSINGVKMYTVAGQNRSLATWLPPKKLRDLRKNRDYMQRVELIQDLKFETATTRIKATPDGEYLIASGIYPPQVKVYELRELSLKFERHLISEIINFQEPPQARATLDHIQHHYNAHCISLGVLREVLADDYSKIAFLCADRSVCLHAKYGSHYSLRIPRMGRDIAYDCWSCDLICAASSPDLYRINLEQGRFLTSLNTQSPALNVVTRSKIHGLVACGGDDGAVECFDTRARSSVGRMNAVAHAGDVDQEVTALEFDGGGGCLMAVGSSVGKVLIYDLRSSRPMRVKDHMYGSSILNIKWHQTLNSERAKLITSDNHVVRIWDPETGEGMTSIEPARTINDICVFDGSGLMLLALEYNQIPSYFIPSLGPAPKWCSYLENLTEEMEEDAQTIIYDNFKFLTKEDLERLNMTHLIGTDVLRAYMHGYFVNYEVYKKAQALANPFAYDDYIEQRKKEKLEAERASRITIKRKLPKVNRVLAAKLLENEEAEKEKKDEDVADGKKISKKKKGLSSELLKDERFAALFENKDFEIDEFSQEYLALHPMAASKKQPSLIEEHFEPAMGDEDRSLSDSDASAASLSSEDDHPDDQSKSKRKSQVPRLYEVKDERHAEAFWNRVSLAEEDSLPLGERVEALTKRQQASSSLDDVKFGPGGSRAISFITKSSAKYKEDEEEGEERRKKRRGVQPLGLKPDRSRFGARGRGGSRGRSRGRGRR